MWWKTLGLPGRLFIILGMLTAIIIGIGFGAVWHAYRFDSMMNRFVTVDVAALQLSREIETELASQKGFATYFFLDGNAKWLSELAIHRMAFENLLKRARDLPLSEDMTALLDKIQAEFEDYVRGKDQVIELYRSGDHESGERLHWGVREKLFQLTEDCRMFRRNHEQRILQSLDETRSRARQTTGIVIALMALSAVLTGLLVFILFSQVLIPIQRLSRKAAHQNENAAEKPGSDMRLLSMQITGLIEDMDRTRTELQQSKQLLMNSEKMALVGKLATEVAHSIRNPMTSINMRLFSLKRNLELTDIQKEDFEVVAEEMRRLDNIVRNFLEFSRPHKLRKQKVDIAAVIDMTIDLLAYRLELHSVSVQKSVGRGLPLLDGDPELLKEVFVNLMVNACEAIENGGEIKIRAEEALIESMGRAVIIQFSDNGPGMSEELQAVVMQPFETTKPDGTGLGLFIAVRIIEEHGGRLLLQSRLGQGTTFTITLPAAGEESS
jgi:signal transduction histidine kinase